MQSIEYFACERSIFLNLDIWTPRYLGAEYWILCTSKKYFLEVRYMEHQVFRCKVLNTLHVQEVFFQSWIYGPQVFRCKVLNTLHVQEVFFSKLDVWTPRYLGAKYWILCTCKKYFFKVGYMDPQVFRCKVFNTLHVQEVYFQSWIYGPPGI